MPLRVVPARFMSHEGWVLLRVCKKNTQTRSKLAGNEQPRVENSHQNYNFTKSPFAFVLEGFSTPLHTAVDVWKKRAAIVPPTLLRP